MSFRNDHQVTVIVGKPVEDHGMVAGPEENKVAFISFVPKERTKKTTGTFTGARAQIDLAPGSPHKVRGSLEVHGFLRVTTK